MGSTIYEQVKERMISYAKVDTQSQPYSGHWPTTDKQINLARMLKDEMDSIGVSDVYLDEERCVVYGRIPSNINNDKAQAIGFIAHMDTAPDASGENVKPWVLENYDGGDITLNKELGIVMKASDYANLQQYIGQDLILTDGTTLLGGDDKASISAIMTMAQYICEHPEFKHGDISLAFTPDEEVGGLAQDLDLDRFGAGLAYTFVRKASLNGEKGAAIVLFFSLFSCLSVLPYIITNYHPMTLQQLCMLLLAGAAATGGQFSVTAAYSHAPSKQISVYDYTQVLWAAFFGFFLFGDIPDIFSIIGYGLIIGAAIIMFLYNQKAN